VARAALRGPVAPLLRPREGMQEICDALKERMPEILERWTTLLNELPWTDEVGKETIDHLPEVVTGLAESALCSPASREARMQQAFAAARHGHDRRRQGWSERQLLQEYHLLRQAIYDDLRENHGADAPEAIFRIDAASTLATMASLRGFHRDKLEAQGRWPAAVEELADDATYMQDEP